jgi:hypothetical protein
MSEVVRLLRAAADELQGGEGTRLLIPEPEEADESYPLGLVPGDYDSRDAAKAVQFLADMLEV